MLKYVYLNDNQLRGMKGDTLCRLSQFIGRNSS